MGSTGVLGRRGKIEQTYRGKGYGKMEAEIEVMPL